LMQWFSPYGWGFPGWHIECSVMARQYLGDTIDLHSGGEDNIFPHHECEIAQSEALTGKPFSNHWIHTRFLQVNGEKMAKRLGNFYVVRDLVAKGHDPLAIRYVLISGNYNKSLNFTDQSLVDAGANVDRFKRCEANAQAAIKADRPGDEVFGSALGDLYEQALEAMLNDLNTPVAIAKSLEGAKLILREGETLSASSGRAVMAFLDQVNALLGIVRNEGVEAVPVAQIQPAVDESNIRALIEERNAAKKAKDYAKADTIRQDLDAQGIELRDTPEGTVWRVKTGV